MRKVKIKNVKDKPMVIHTKNKFMLALKESKKSIKTKKTSIRVAGSEGTQLALSQMEGGDEVKEAANIANMAIKPVKEVGSNTLFAKRRRIKKVEAGKKLSKKLAKETAKQTSKESSKIVSKECAKTAVNVGTTLAGTAASSETGPYALVIGKAASKKVGEELDKIDDQITSRNRKIRFFLDKLKPEEEQQDSIVKLMRDLLLNKLIRAAKKKIAFLGGLLATQVMLVLFIALPVIALITIFYNSPFAFFLPPLQAGDTVTTVTSAYQSDFNTTINTLANEHIGYDSGQIVYVDFEGESAGNFNDIVTIYMVKYGVGETATVMNDTSKQILKTVFDDMCSYTTSEGIENIENEDGTITTQSILNVNVTLKNCYDMITEYGFDSQQIELVEEMMRMFGSTSGVTPQSSMTQEEVDAILQGITDPTQRTVVSYALTKVGYPYSQKYRDSGSYYDCSSLAYYSWKEAGIDISFGGATTAAAEAQGLESANKNVSYNDIQPGDLIFYSYTKNGRYKNISHVAVYVGNGMVVEAKGTAYGVTYNEVPNLDDIVVVGRPSM